MKFIKWGFMQNTWVWFHILGGAFLAKFLIQFFDDNTSFSILLAVVLVWEIYEFFSDGMEEGMVKIYGSLERWAYDSLGDVLGALIVGILIIY